ncbi:MAG: HAD-IC family P-type ATPase, partial [Nitrospira sp.]|nr:HAD-IC family P-type ATPase [Nitrospira sp.]
MGILLTPQSASVGSSPVASPTWHRLSSEEVAHRLGADLTIGLSRDEVDRRTEEYGANEILERPPRPPWRMLLDQFTDFMILVLIGAAIISGIIGEPADALAIVVIVLLNGAIGFVQEYRAERAIAALKLLAAQSARVKRDGETTIVPAIRLVPGDLVSVEAGDVLPADLRLVDAAKFKVDEAALTGESVPVEKRTNPLGEEDLSLGDRLNMGYKGTLATYGRGTGVVVATGMCTELGKIAALLEKQEVLKTPLQRRLAVFGRRLAIAALGICGIIFIVGLLRGESAVLMFLTAVSLAVAAIPEALPAIVTVALALGARRMVKKRALIRRLPAVETLGSVTYICSDKTGTLTQNKMRVEVLFADGRMDSDVVRLGSYDGPWPHLFKAMALSNDAVKNQDDRLIGDPTETALYLAAEEAGVSKKELLDTMPRLAELPFDSDRKRMTTFHRRDEEVVAFTKGAPEAVLALCDKALVGDVSGSIDQEALAKQAETMASEGLRVLAVACRDWMIVP